MKKELLKQQLVPLLCFGLPAWGIALLLVIFRQTLFVALIWFVYLIPFGVNRGKFRDLYKTKYQPKWGGELTPHYVEGDEELNQYYAINLRWLIIFWGIILILLITAGLFPRTQGTVLCDADHAFIREAFSPC